MAVTKPGTIKCVSVPSQPVEHVEHMAGQPASTQAALTGPHFMAPDALHVERTIGYLVLAMYVMQDGDCTMADADVDIMVRSRVHTDAMVDTQL